MVPPRFKAATAASTATATTTALVLRKSFLSLSLLWLVFLSKQLWVSTNFLSLTKMGSSSSNSNIGDGWAATIATTLTSAASASTTTNSQALGHRPIPASDDSLRLIFLISMGQEAMQSKLVERFVWSARHRGEWQGWIVLLTDAPASRYVDLSFTKDDDHFIVMNPLGQHFNSSFGEDMPYKRFKTHVIDYVDMDPRLDAVQLIYYLDVDIIVGNSLPQLFHSLESTYDIPIPDAPLQKESHHSTNPAAAWLSSIPKIWFFRNKYAHLTVQGGQFILDRSTSQPCLDFWRELIDSNVTEVKDQPALHKMRLHQEERIDPYLKNKQTPPIPARCQIVTMEWKRYLHFPANSTVFSTVVDKIQKNKRPVLHTLIHFKNSCNSTSQINEDVEEQFIEYYVQNKELSQKIHVQPDGGALAKRSIGIDVGRAMKHVIDANGRIHLE